MSSIVNSVNNLKNYTVDTWLMTVGLLVLAGLFIFFAPTIAEGVTNVVVDIVGSIMKAILPVQGDDAAAKKIYGTAVIGLVIGGVAMSKITHEIGDSGKSRVIWTALGSIVMGSILGGITAGTYCKHCPDGHPQKEGALCYKGECEDEFGKEWSKESIGVCKKGPGWFAPRKWRSVRPVVCKKE